MPIHKINRTKHSLFDGGEYGLIVSNLMMLSVAFMVHFAAYNGTQNVQSTLNGTNGMYALLTLKLASLLTNVFLSVTVIG